MSEKGHLGNTNSEEEDDHIYTGIKRLAAWLRSPDCNYERWKYEAREFILVADEALRGLSVDGEELFQFVDGLPDMPLK